MEGELSLAETSRVLMSPTIVHKSCHRGFRINAHTKGVRTKPGCTCFIRQVYRVRVEQEKYLWSKTNSDILPACCGYLTSNQKVLIYRTHTKKQLPNFIPLL